MLFSCIQLLYVNKDRNGRKKRRYIDTHAGFLDYLSILSTLKKITIAAMKTPIDWMKSPTTWIKAAETLMFSPNNWRNISTMKMTMMSLTVFLRRGALLDVPVRMAVAAY